MKSQNNNLFKRKIEHNNSARPRKQQNLNLRDDSSMEVGSVNPDTTKDSYIESKLEPIYLTFSNNVEVNDGKSNQVDSKVDKFEVNDQTSVVLSRPTDNVELQIENKCHTNDLQYKNDEVLRENDMKKNNNSNLFRDILMKDICTVNSKMSSSSKLVNVTSKLSSESITDRKLVNKIYKNEPNIEEKFDCLGISKTELFMKGKLYEASDLKENIKNKLGCQTYRIASKQKNTESGVTNRLSYSAYSDEQQQPLMADAIHIDPWSVPEIYLDSIEIVVCKGASRHIKKPNSNEGTIDIIPLDNNSPVFVTENIDIKPVVDEKKVDTQNVFKPHLIQPILLMDNCLPIDILSAPSMQYPMADCKSPEVGEKSQYYNNILSDMKFNEAFLQYNSTGDNSFYELLGVNLFDTGINLSLDGYIKTELNDLPFEDYLKTEVKEEFKICPFCFLDKYRLLDDDLEIPPKIKDVCKCNLRNLKCYKNRNELLYLKRGKLKINENCRSVLSSSGQCDMFNEPLDNRSISKLYFSNNEYTENNSNTNLPVEMLHCINTESCFIYEKYGDICYSPEYFEYLHIFEENTQDIHFQCEHAMFNYEDIFLSNDQPANIKSNSDNLTNTNILNNKCETNQLNNFKDKNVKVEINLEKHRPILNYGRKELPLSIEKQMMQNPSKALNDTGWIVSLCNPRINCTLNAECPTEVPFSLKNEYFISAPDLVSWNLDDCITKTLPTDEITISKKKIKEPITTKNEIWKPDSRWLLSKTRPINAINNGKLMKNGFDAARPSPIARHFGGLLNRMPRLDNDSKKEFQYISKSSGSNPTVNNGGTEAGHGGVPNTETTAVKCDKVSKKNNNICDAKVKDSKAKLAEPRNLNSASKNGTYSIRKKLKSKSIRESSNDISKIEKERKASKNGTYSIRQKLKLKSIRESAKPPNDISKIKKESKASKNGTYSIRKQLLSKSISESSKPPKDISKIKKKRKIRCDKLAHSIFSSHIMENLDRKLPVSVCVLLKGKLFVYNHDCS